jgi:hypothetical protein
LTCIDSVPCIHARRTHLRLPQVVWNFRQARQCILFSALCEWNFKDFCLHHPLRPLSSLNVNDSESPKIQCHSIISQKLQDLSIDLRDNCSFSQGSRLRVQTSRFDVPVVRLNAGCHLNDSDIVIFSSTRIGGMQRNFFDRNYNWI